MRELDTRYGKLAFPDYDQDTIGQFLETYGEWAWLEVEFLAEQLPPAARVLDVGAFVGTFGLGIAQAGDVSFVCAVEGNQAVVPVLRTNLDSLLPARHLVVDSLVAPGSGTYQGAPTEPGNVGSMSFRPTVGDVGAPGATATVGLPGLRAAHGPFDLVKLDVEGMELDLLRDDALLVSEDDSTTALWVECNDTRQSLEVAELLIGRGRPVHVVSFPVTNPTAHRTTDQPIYPFACEAGLFVGTGVPELSGRLRDVGCRLEPVTSSEQLRRFLWQTPRWGDRDWLELSRHELVALLGHAVHGEDLGSYLMADLESTKLPPRGEREGLLEDTLAEMQTFAFAQAATAAREARRADAAERSAAHLQSRVLALLAGEGVPLVDP